ncbi:MAG: hypothetical protein OSB47_08960, partial [Pirellulaceae bacterium]|nr:hypothetical protein [Pirellulaceae bacterium]
MCRMISRERGGWRRYEAITRRSCIAWILLLVLFSAGVIRGQGVPADQPTATATVDDATGDMDLEAEAVAVQEDLEAEVDAVKEELFVDATYWLEEQVFPRSMQGVHFLLKDYQWYCLVAVIFLGFFADLVTRQTLKWLTRAWFRYVRTGTEKESPQNPWKPLGLLAQVLTWYWGTRFIGLPVQLTMVLLVALKFFAVFVAVWTTFRLIDV